MTGRKSDIFGWRLLVLAVWFGTCTVSCVSMGAMMKPEQGFRGIPWETRLETLDGMKTLYNRGPRLTYAVREDEELGFGDARLDTVEYEFEEGRFAGAILEYTGYNNSKELQLELEKRFGPPAVVNKRMNLYLWQTGDVKWLLRYYRMQNKGELRLTKGK